MGKVIGLVTSCESREHAYLRGHQVKIIAVLKGAADPNLDPEDGYPIATTDEELERLGGLEANDRVEVQPYLPEIGRYSFVASDPKVTDLAGWESLIATK